MATIDLQKKSVKIVLEKKQLTKVTARVGLVLDITGSMRPLYKNGTVQNVVERILAVADQFDDNGLLDVWVYDNEFPRLKPVSEKDFPGYVDREILNNDRLHKFGRNDEPPVMKDVLRNMLRRNRARILLSLFLSMTGAVKSQSNRLIEASSDKPVFWQFVGIGNGNFDFLNKLDTLEGRVIDNTNFLHIEEIDRISDDELYDALLAEFPFWLKEAKEKGIVREQEPPAEKPKKKGFFSRLFSK
nr:hypothetical protein [Bacillus subtilis]